MRRGLLYIRAARYVLRAQWLLRAHDTTTTMRRLVRGRRLLGVRDGDALAAVRRVGRVTHASCLPQSMALAALLSRAGADANLVLGCRRYDAGGWGAHAWVEVDRLALEPVLAGPHEELAVLEGCRGWQLTRRD